MNIKHTYASLLTIWSYIKLPYQHNQHKSLTIIDHCNHETIMIFSTITHHDLTID